MTPQERALDAAHTIEIKRMLSGSPVSEKGMAVEIEPHIRAAVAEAVERERELFYREICFNCAEERPIDHWDAGRPYHLDVKGYPAVCQAAAIRQRGKE